MAICDTLRTCGGTSVAATMTLTISMPSRASARSTPRLKSSAVEARRSPVFRSTACEPWLSVV